MLDEALEVLTGLWRGEKFSYDGQHYQVTGAHFLPAPVQAPRIPIWVAGLWPNKAPFRRAARWDGVFPLYCRVRQDLSPLQFREIVAYIQEHRRTDAPFEFAHRGMIPGQDPSQGFEVVAPYVEAGVTWWLENVHPWRFRGDKKGRRPSDAMREWIAKGPPKA